MLGVTDKDGYYFIDQDGTHFRHIINFLRNPESYVNTLMGPELLELKNQSAYHLLIDEMFPTRISSINKNSSSAQLDE